MQNKSDIENNLAALKKLRSLPRGTHVESRIAAIQNLLGEVEIFRTLQNLRWPLGVTCPRCHSHNIVYKEPPKGVSDKRQHYECLDCKQNGDPSDFDDLTGITTVGDTLNQLREWMLCWYLIGFCSVSQIANLLGLPVSEVIRLAEQGANLTETHDKSLKQLEQGFFSKWHKDAKHKQATKKEKEVALDDLRTRSRSIGKYKPGPKSSA